MRITIFEQNYDEYKSSIKSGLLNNKMRITLSKYAAEILKSDMMIFEDCTIDDLNDVITSDRICRIFLNYYKDASASIYHALRKKELHLKEMLNGLGNNEEAIERLLIGEELRLMELSYGRLGEGGASKSIRIRNNVAREIFDPKNVAEDRDDKNIDVLSQFFPIYARKKYDEKTLEFLSTTKSEEKNYDYDEEKKKETDFDILKKIAEFDFSCRVDDVKKTAQFLKKLRNSSKLNIVKAILEDLGVHEQPKKGLDNKKEIMYFISRLMECNDKIFGEFVKRAKKEPELNGGGKTSDLKLNRKTIKFLGENDDFRYLEFLDEYDMRTLRMFIAYNPQDLKLYFYGGDPGYYYGNNMSRYMKAVIEEYATLPFVERERIYYKENIDALMKGCLCKIKVTSSGSSRNGAIEFKPYFVEPDEKGLYNYIAGYKHENGKWKIDSIKLRSIKDDDITTYAEFARTKRSEETLRKAIDEYQIEYLSSFEKSTKKVPIIVEFTEKGEEMYKQRILHMRPLYTERDGRVYTFECSEYQAENYFFRLGKEVKIISPVSLAKKMQKKFYEGGEAIIPFASERITFGVEEDYDGNKKKCIFIARKGLENKEGFEYKFEFDGEMDNYIFVSGENGKNNASKAIKSKFEGVFESIENELEK